MEKRITIVTGHYGSGKTEFSVNYAVRMKQTHEKTALVDLDIANPYFRSRERKDLLENTGITVYSNTFGYDITADLPAITASVRTPLESGDTYTIVDAGGDDSGARVLNQFRKYFLGEDTEVLCVINANRPETSDLPGAIHHIRAIEGETGLKVSALVNNTHLLKETTAEDLWKGWELCEALSKDLGIPIKFHCVREDLLPQVLQEKEQFGRNLEILPIKLYMRPSWLDR